MTISDRVRVKNVERALRRHYLLKKSSSTIAAATANGRRKSAKSTTAVNAATLLPYNLRKRTVVLARQFRLPAYRCRP